MFIKYIALCWNMKFSKNSDEETTSLVSNVYNFYKIWRKLKANMLVSRNDRIHDNSVVLNSHNTEHNLLLDANTTMDLDGQDTIYSQQAF